MTKSHRPYLLPAVLGVITSLAQILTARDTYGIFRDELYYLANGQHLAFGYVDHPPLIGLVAWISRTVFGESQIAIRLLPAVAAGMTVALACLIARELGGGRFAQVLTGITTALAPVYVALFGYLSMNSFDVLFWTAAIYVLVRLLASRDLRLWLPFGLIAGLGLENKISMLFLGFGFVVGLLITRDWSHFRSRWFWLAGATAFVLFLPFLIWQAIHGWPVVEFMQRATQFKNLPLSPLSFLHVQALQMNPLAVPIALAGLGFLLLSKQGRPHRALGWALLAILVLLISQRAKPYYLAPAFALLLAPGSVALEKLTARRVWRWLRPTYPALILVSGLALAPLAKPVLPVETHVAYMDRLGMKPSTGERKELGRLSQFFADRLGWRELAETVATVYRDLPADDKSNACVFGQNYGQAAAIDYYRSVLDLPPAISGHNSYFFWGPGGCTGELIIVIDDDRQSLEQIFEEVTLATTYTCRDCMPYENNKPIWVCRGMRLPVEQVWPQVRDFN